VFFVRLLIPDTDAVSPIFSDEEIQSFLLINQLTWQSSMYYSYHAGSQQLPLPPSNFLRAAALALNTLAGNASRLACIQQLLDVKLSPEKAAKALQDTAQRRLRPRGPSAIAGSPCCSDKLEGALSHDRLDCTCRRAVLNIVSRRRAAIALVSGPRETHAG